MFSSKETTEQTFLPVLTILARLFLETNLVASLHGVRAKPRIFVSFKKVIHSICQFLEFNLACSFYKTSFKPLWARTQFKYQQKLIKIGLLYVNVNVPQQVNNLYLNGRDRFESITYCSVASNVQFIFLY